jgi:hypothetical protein
MNMSTNDYHDQEFDYQFKGERRTQTEKPSRQRKMQYSRANRPTVMHNGIHRRRNKRFSW